MAPNIAHVKIAESYKHKSSFNKVLGAREAGGAKRQPRRAAKEENTTLPKIQGHPELTPKQNIIA